ncbi:hypothetical protein SAMN05444000_10446 [Shimia gijangensis]|uniref:Lipoprotein n=1 Tax=Shimia gijangensis TaxID=1470563 RepID=A0A1M6FDW2_9RHOB|nr:hypothetical protein [Shimia gijangensis]SHI95829.1 hypothetical protein SAMN05444000_10446 [Shimia gijangensis]
MTRFLRLCTGLLIAMSLAACAVNKDNASDEEIRAVAYSDGGQPRLTLYTMVSNDTGSGAHTSLLINGSQRVAWDPAGSFRAEGIVARGDVVYGMSPKMVDYYTRYHARETYHVIIQELDVSPEIAEQALRTVASYGAVPQSQCALSTSAIMRSLPGFEALPSTYYPNKLEEAFAQYGPTRKELWEYDADDKSKVLQEYNSELVAQQRAARESASE